jgi:hypothetical protein
MRKLPLFLVLAATTAAPADTAKKAKKVGPVQAKKAPAPTPPPPPPVTEEQDPPDPYQQKQDELERRRAALPKPPSIEPMAYQNWFRRLPIKTRQAIDQLCIEMPADFEESCGGIGIHRIPRPPSLVAQGGFQKHAEWKKSLNKLQLAHFNKYCGPELGGEDGYGYSQLCGGTPLVISFDNRPVEFQASSAKFELYPGDATMTTDWPTAATPWLALDRDGDGAITSGAELFGDATTLPNGARARNGFEALAALDANGDGRIDRADPMFASLLLWADKNGDRKSSPDELVRASTMLDSISLGYRVEARCDARVNCERERASVSWHDGNGGGVKTGSVVDVYLKFQ